MIKKFFAIAIVVATCAHSLKLDTESEIVGKGEKMTVKHTLVFGASNDENEEQVD